MRLTARIGVAIVVLLTAGGCGSSQQAVVPAGDAPSHRSIAPTRPLRLRVGSTMHLPAAVQLPAVTGTSNGVLELGGLNASDESVANIVAIEGDHARRIGELPQALHDAAASSVDGQTYFIGGGGPGAPSSAIQRVSRTGLSTLAQRLPVGASDVEAATIGGIAYIVGGYTDTEPLRTIVAFTPGRGARVVAEMPRPLRYAAVAAVGGHLLIAGGTSGVVAQRAILSFDPASDTVRQIGALPVATTHAAGASLNGRFYVLGGRGENLSSQRRSILAIDPTSGVVRPAGRLPQPLSDPGVASLPGRIVLVGGRNPAGVVSDEALSLEVDQP